MPSSSFVSRSRARRLRRDQTDAERLLWAHLRARQITGAKFRRQFPIGNHIVDFCCFGSRLVVELDGGQHTEQVAADQRRTASLESRGFRILRFWDNEVLTNLEGVLQRILEALETSSVENP